MPAEVVTLRETNFRQAAQTMRVIADEIDAGTYGRVASVAIVILGDKLDVFGCGPESEAASISLMLRAGSLRMERALEEHGK